MRLTTVFTQRHAQAQAAPRSAAHAAWMLRWSAVALLCAGVMAVTLPHSAYAQSKGRANLSASGAPNYLKVGTLMEFDKTKVRTVGDAMMFLLEPVHYQITTRTVDPALAASILRRQVPPAAVNAGVMSIESGLLLLIGEDQRLVVDHINRLVTIERMPAE